MNIQKKLIERNYNVGRTYRGVAYKVDYLILHTYDGKGTSLFNWFNRINGTSSAHASIWFDGTIEQYVEFDNTSWAASDAIVNFRSVNVEHMDNKNPGDAVRSDKLYESSAQFAAYICKTFSLPCKVLTKDQYLAGERGIIPHRFTAKDGRTCPGGLDMHRIQRRALELLKGPVVSNPGSLEFVIAQPNWGVSHVALMAGFPDYGDKSAWNRIAQLNGFDDYTKFKIHPGQKVRVLPQSTQEDPKMIKELEDKLVQKEQELSNKNVELDISRNLIAERTLERDRARVDLQEYKEKVSSEFFAIKSESESKYAALEIIKRGLEDQIRDISKSDELEDTHYVSNYQKLQEEKKTIEEEKKVIEEEKAKVVAEMEELKQTMGASTPSKGEMSNFLHWIKEIAFSPEKLAALHKYLPSPKMFLWKKWGKQHTLKEVLQKAGTWFLGSSLGATIWIGVDALNQVANQPIPERWTRETLLGFMGGTALILIKVLQKVARRNEPIIKAVETVNPAIDVYKAQEKVVVAIEPKP